MRTQDVLVRVASMISVFAAGWNILMAGLWFVTLIWLLVGVLWLVPLVLAFVEILACMAFMIVGFNKGTSVAPLLGLFVSACCFNPIAFGLEFMSLLLMIGGFVIDMNEQKEASNVVAMAA